MSFALRVKKNHADSPISFASSKCKARFVCIRAGGHGDCHTEEASQDRKSKKRQDGKNDFCTSDGGVFETGGAFKAYYMAIRGEPRAFEHQPRRQKICERELRIRVDCKALENILFGLRSAGARVLVVHVSHQLQALSTSQHVLLRVSGPCDPFSRSLSECGPSLTSKLRFCSRSISEKRSAT